MAKAKSITENLDVEINENDLLDSVLKKFGESLVPQEEKVKSISTGSFALDASIGIGGIPRGRFTEAYGPEGVAKTTLGLCTSKEVLKNGGSVLYIDAEVMLSYGTIESMVGETFDPKRFILIQPDTAEEAFIIVEDLIGKVDLVVIDTIAALEPLAEKKKDLTDSTVAEISRLLPKFFRRNAPAVKKSDTAFLLLNQVRDKVGSYTQGYNSPGGHAMKHWASVIIALTKSGDIEVSGEKVGVKSKFVIRKNKLAPPFRSFTIPITFGKGVDYYMDLLEFTEMLGVVQKGGSYYKFEGETIGQGKFAASEYLENNPEVTKRIIEQTYLVIKGNKGIEIPDEEFASEEELDIQEE